MEENFYGGEDLIPVLSWKAQQLEDSALSAPEIAAAEMREQAQFFREAVSQLRGERIPTTHTEAQQGLLLNTMKEYLNEHSPRTVRKG